MALLLSHTQTVGSETLGPFYVPAPREYVRQAAIGQPLPGLFVPATYTVALSSGTGVNSWTVEPVLLGDSQGAAPDLWLEFPVPPMWSGIIFRPAFAETDLPFGDSLDVPVTNFPFGLRFIRSGAGTSLLQLEWWMPDY